MREESLEDVGDGDEDDLYAERLESNPVPLEES